MGPHVYPVIGRRLMLHFRDISWHQQLLTCGHVVDMGLETLLLIPRGCMIIAFCLVEAHLSHVFHLAIRSCYRRWLFALYWIFLNSMMLSSCEESCLCTIIVCNLYLYTNKELNCVFDCLRHVIYVG